MSRVTLHPESEHTDRWRFTVRSEDRRLAYQCEVDAKLAFASRISRWWRERGNPGMAKYEASRWAEARALEMAERAFREA